MRLATDSLADHCVESVPHPGARFRVKAHPRDKPGDADPFDAPAETQVRAVSADQQCLLAPSQIRAAPQT